MNSVADRRGPAHVAPGRAPKRGGLPALIPQRVRDVWEYRELIRTLVARNLKVRYKNSVLGILWSLLNPLVMMLVFTVLFQVMWNNNEIRLYYVFVLVGLLPWQFFVGGVMEAIHSVVGNGNLVKKVYFPRDVLPIATVLSQLVHFLLALLVLVPILVLSGVGLTQHALWLPVIILTQVIFILGLAFMLSTFNVYYRDTAMVMDLALLAWFFLTPIFWPIDILPQSKVIGDFTVNVHRLVRWLNPMASIIDSYRTALYGTVDGAGPAQPDLYFLARTLVTALILLGIGWWIFRRKSHEFGEEI